MPQLAAEEEALCEPELKHALRLIEAVAKRLEQEDDYGERSAYALRGLATGLERQMRAIASGRAYRGDEQTRRTGWRRFFAKPS